MMMLAHNESDAVSLARSLNPLHATFTVISPDAQQQDQVWSGLMLAAQDGDARAYERLLGLIAPFIRTLLRRQIRSPESLEDVLQDVLLCVHRVRHTYDPHRPFTPWLAAIVSRRAIDALRRGGRIAKNETLDEDAAATFVDSEANNALTDGDSQQQVQELLAQLPVAQREALELLKLREMSLAEASKVTGLSIGALKVSVHRAIKTLRAKLEGQKR